MYNNNSSTNSGTANVGAVVTNNVGDGEYYNLTSKTGWFMESLNTNLQSCGNVEFNTTTLVQIQTWMKKNLASKV